MATHTHTHTRGVYVGYSSGHGQLLFKPRTCCCCCCCAFLLVQALSPLLFLSFFFLYDIVCLLYGPLVLPSLFPEGQRKRFETRSKKPTVTKNLKTQPFLFILCFTL